MNNSFFNFRDSPYDRIHDMGIAYEKLQQLLDTPLFQQSTSKHNEYWHSETESEKLDDIRRSISCISDTLYEIKQILDKPEQL